MIGFRLSRLSRANNALQYSFLRAALYTEARVFNCRFLIPFISTALAAKSFRFPCGSFRAPPATRMHRFPTATPHVGQRTDDICLRVSFFVFISRVCCSRALHFSGRGVENRIHVPTLRFLDGHGSVLQELDEQCLVYLQASVVADQALPFEIVHELTYSCSGGANHLRQG